MENCEKQKDEIFNLAIKGQKCALYKGKVVSCDRDVSCIDCDLGINSSGDYRNCSIKFEEWCHKEYEEPKIQEEVKNCKIDDKVIVSDDGKNWYKKHFSHYDIYANKVYCYWSGKSSWTTSEIYGWEYARLPKESEL